MTHRVERKKWILRRHTWDWDKICTVADTLKNYSKSSISNEDKTLLQNRLKELKLYNERNPEMPLDAISHKIITLAFYMFGYRDKKKFLFSPLGHLFLKYKEDEEKIRYIFFTMIWGLQFPHPDSGTDESFKLYPFRLIYKLLNDKRLNYELFSFEISYILVFVKEVDITTYEDLVHQMLKLRKLSDAELTKLFNKDRHAYVNAVYEWDYYTSKVFEKAKILDREEGSIICRLQHGTTQTFRKVTRTKVKIPSELQEYCNVLLSEYGFDEKPLNLNDSERLKIDVVKEIYSFYPKVLNQYINEHEDDTNKLEELLELPKLIEQYSNNNDGKEAYLFEDILEEAFNMFNNVEARKIGGAGQADLECLFLDIPKKFAVDAKSTKNKLSSLNTSRLGEHREKIGAKYTIVVTPRYVPAVKRDIRNSDVVILLANTFSEFLYNCIYNDFREIDYAEFDEIIENNMGQDISSMISELTMEKFALDS